MSRVGVHRMRTLAAMPSEDHATIDRALDAQRDRIARYQFALRAFSAALWLVAGLVTGREALFAIVGYLLVATVVLAVGWRHPRAVRRWGFGTGIPDIAFLFLARYFGHFVAGTDPVRVYLLTIAGFVVMVFVGLFSLQRGVILVSALLAVVGSTVLLAKGGDWQGIAAAVFVCTVAGRSAGCSWTGSSALSTPPRAHKRRASGSGATSPPRSPIASPPGAHPPPPASTAK